MNVPPTLASAASREPLDCLLSASQTSLRCLSEASRSPPGRLAGASRRSNPLLHIIWLSDASRTSLAISVPLSDTRCLSLSIMMPPSISLNSRTSLYCMHSQCSLVPQFSAAPRLRDLLVPSARLRSRRSVTSLQAHRAVGRPVVLAVLIVGSVADLAVSSLSSTAALSVSCTSSVTNLFFLFGGQPPSLCPLRVGLGRVVQQAPLQALR